MKRIVFIGGGAFAKEVAEVAVMAGHQVVGYVADYEGSFDRPYWGAMDVLLERPEDYDAVFIAFGSFDRKSALRRAEIVDWIERSSLPSIPLVSPKSTVSPKAVLAEGVYVGHGAILSVDVTIGPYAIVNTAAVISHDSSVGRNANLAPCSFVAGNSHVGDNTLVAPGALILEKRMVGANVVVGVGATVLRDVPSGSMVMPSLSRMSKDDV